MGRSTEKDCADNKDGQMKIQVETQDRPVKPPFVRTPYNYDMNKASMDSALWTPEDAESKTIQSAKDDADINVIVKRFGLTGHLPQNMRLPQYGDYTGVNDFHTAMNVVRQAQETFMELPADVRNRFGNDPQAFLEFCSDPSNMGELVKMGLATEIEEVIMETKPANPAGNKSGDNNVDDQSGATVGAAASGKAGNRGKTD